MRQKISILLGLILVIAVLIGINAVSYTQKDVKSDTELNPNRSTFNSGATGTRAFYDLLGETGRKISRWQESPARLLSYSESSPKTFVIVGQTRIDIEKEEIEQILKWVSNGGKLVIISRDPPSELLPKTIDWSVSYLLSPDVAFDVDPSNQPQMIIKTEAGKPVKPTIFTKNVSAVQPSRFSSSAKITFSENKLPSKVDEIKVQTNKNSAVKTTPAPVYNDDNENPPIRQAPAKSGQGQVIQQSTDDYNEEDIEPAPFIHVASKDKNIVVDYEYGAGQIVFITDPFIISNAGISLVDNAQLALNVVSSREGLIAFDEYHHGYGITNPIFNYFEGTPFISIFLQILVIILAILFTQSRRFARPLPINEPNRLSKLEYVSAMAQLQESTRAYDLAIENIYTEFRRSVTRLFGVDNYTISRKDLAGLIAERAKYEPNDIENIMYQCEIIINGEPTNKHEVLQLTTRLREIEEKLNLKRKRKEAFRK